MTGQDQPASEKGLTIEDLGVNSSFTQKDGQKAEQKDAKGIYDFALKLEGGQKGMTQAEKGRFRNAVKKAAKMADAIAKK